MSSTAATSVPAPTPGSAEGALIKPTSTPLTEVPSSLKQLARLVVRGFYSIEDSLIVDMLVRYPCMREEDLSELLKFDRKFLRARMAGLVKDKLVHMKQRIETDAGGEGANAKVTRMNCYFINYKIFVNIVKYKLDLMHKKMETSERDATTRSNFRCSNCSKTFTDLEANQLFDPQTMEFRCTYCSGEVVEDDSAGPQADSRQLLAKFNTQMEKLYELLRTVENIKLAQSVLEPEPVELGLVGKDGKPLPNQRQGPAGPDGRWSGDATRGMGLRAEDQKLSVTFGETSADKEQATREMPIWMQQSTVTQDADDSNSGMAFIGGGKDDEEEEGTGAGALSADQSDEITSMLLRHEKRTTSQAVIPGAESDSDKQSDESDMDENDVAAAFGKEAANLESLSLGAGTGGDTANNQGGRDQQVEDMSDDDDDDDGGDVPTVTVGGQEIAVTDVDEAVIARMTSSEKERYTQTFQDFYAHVYD